MPVEVPDDAELVHEEDDGSSWVRQYRLPGGGGYAQYGAGPKPEESESAPWHVRWRDHARSIAGWCLHLVSPRTEYVHLTYEIDDGHGYWLLIGSGVPRCENSSLGPDQQKYALRWARRLIPRNKPWRRYVLTGGWPDKTPLAG